MRITIEINRRTLVRAGIAAGAIVVLAGAFAFGRKLLGPGTEPPRAGATRSPSPSPAPGGLQMTSFVDGEAGYSLQYPKSWRNIERLDPTIRFLAGPSLESGDFAQVKLVLLGEEIGPAEVAALKPTLDQIVVSAPDVVVFVQRQIVLNGLPGWYYLRTFKESATGREGVHAYYFLFEGRKFYQLVFQAIPTEDFDKLVDVFDAISVSFRSTAAARPSPSPS